MLGYRSIKPHDPATCQACTPFGAGHLACMNANCPGAGDNDGAGRIATQQSLRHATEDEYAALPYEHLPIDGVARKLVVACDACAESAFAPFCVHPEPQPEPCPTCQAQGEDPCLRQDGVTPLHFRHADRTEPPTPVCLHAHRPECEIFEGCACHTDDQPPQRPKRPLAGAPEPDTSRLLIGIAAAQMLLLRKGVGWARVRSAASVWTQDNEPALQAEVLTVDDAGHLVYDEHGHPVIETVVIPIVAPPRQEAVQDSTP